MGACAPHESAARERSPQCALRAQVKLHLEEAYAKDLTAHKDLVKELITSIVTQLDADK